MKSYTITMVVNTGMYSEKYLKAPSGGTYLFGSKGVVAGNGTVKYIQGSLGSPKNETISDFYIRLS